MSGSLRQEITDELSFAAGTVVHTGKTLATVCGGIDRRSPAARAATTTTLAVVMAVLIGCAMHLQEVWWAAISAYVSTHPQSIARGLRRIAGTILGAVLAIVSIDWLAYDPVTCCLVLFAVTAVSIIGFNVSQHSYAWLFVSITFGMVLLTSLSDPESAFSVGVGRSIEVAIGTCAGMVVATVLTGGPASSGTPARGWSDLLGRKLPIVLHAIRSGVMVALMPIMWSTFDLPGASQMAVTLAAVLATPVLTDLDETHRRIVGRGLQRLFGCFVGGLSALALLGLSFDFVLPWLIALSAGVWLFAYVQHGTHDATYVGTQAGAVFIITLVQGAGPPESILPGIDRFAGISLGLLMFFLTMFLIRPPPPTSAPAARRAAGWQAPADAPAAASPDDHLRPVGRTISPGALSPAVGCVIPGDGRIRGDETATDEAA
jgi:uncharacterized membrane protein YccC